MRIRRSLAIGARAGAPHADRAHAGRRSCADHWLAASLLALFIAGAAGGAEVMVIDESCFEDLSTCERVYKPSAPSPESQPGPAPQAQLPNLAALPRASASPGSVRFTNDSLGLIREQLLPDRRRGLGPESRARDVSQPAPPEEKRSPGARPAPSGSQETPRPEASPTAEGTSGAAYTRCVETSIRAGNALGESSRVCRSVHGAAHSE